MDEVKQQSEKGFPTTLEESNPDHYPVQRAPCQLRLDRGRGRIILEPREDSKDPRDRLEVPLATVKTVLRRGTQKECCEPVKVDNVPASTGKCNHTYDFLLFIDRDADRIGVKDKPDDKHAWQAQLSDLEKFLRLEGVL